MATAPPMSGLEGASKERFFRYFQKEVIALQEQMSRLANTSAIGGERADAIDHCLAGISRLSSEVMDAAAYIPAYDQRTYGEAIKALSEKLQATRTELNGGQKKFSFKTKKNKSAISIGEAAQMAQNKKLLGPGTSGWNSSEASSAVGSAFAPTPLELLSPGDEKREMEFMAQENAAPRVDIIHAGDGAQGLEPKGVTVSSQDGAHVVLPANTPHPGSSGTVTNVKRSIVDLSAPTTNGAPYATLTLKDIEESVIVCGQVSGAIHITGLENSVIVTSCRQFRMHGSKRVRVYLYSSSRPIIEDCEEILFAPLPKTFVTNATPKSKNQWDQIDDFKWLKAEPSPHFSILPDSQRVQEDVWSDYLSGKQQDSSPETLVSILQAVGVSTS